MGPKGGAPGPLFGFPGLAFRDRRGRRGRSTARRPAIAQLPRGERALALSWAGWAPEGFARRERGGDRWTLMRPAPPG
jgi:hypothetical protein